MGGTTTISISASNARRAMPAASRRSRSRRAMAATSRSPGGSPTRRCIHAPGCPSRRCRWRRSRPNADRSFWKNRSDAFRVDGGGMRVWPQPLGERENDCRNDEGQVNADQPIQLTVGFMIDVHEGLEQLDCRNGDDRGHQFELEFAEVDLGDPMWPPIVLP